jgi:hypothetical protein
MFHVVERCLTNARPQVQTLVTSGKKKERKKISRNLMISIENEILYEK